MLVLRIVIFQRTHLLNPDFAYFKLVGHKLKVLQHVFDKHDFV